MKAKILSICIACSMLITMESTALTVNAVEVKETPTEAIAEVSSGDKVYGDLEYIVESDNTITITDYNGWEKYIIFSIPSKIENKPVTKIGKSAFEPIAEKSILESVTIPNTVTAIEHRAFSGCSTLKSISIPNGVKEIGESAFNGCTKLESISLPNKITEIKHFTFNDCKSLKKIVIPNSVVDIYQLAFENCTNLSDVTFSNNLTTIGTGAFQNCKNLKNVNLPDSVTTIGQSSFQYCSSLTNIILPSKVTTIADSTFKGCTGLKEVTISENVEIIDCYAFENCTSLRSIRIPKSVKMIDEGCFIGCTNLKGIAIENNDIEFSLSVNFAIFKDCKKLTVYGNKGSNSEKYAKKYSIPFKTLSSFESDMNNGKIGDIDDDDKVTSADALLVLRNSVNLEYFTEREKKLANVDGDNKITSADSLSILRYSVGFKDKGTVFYK